MKTLTEQCQELAKKYTFHKQNCSLNNCALDSDPQNDYCSCGIRERRADLAVDIENLTRNQNVA